MTQDNNNAPDYAGHSGAHTPGPWRWMHHGGGAKTDLVAGIENVIMQIYESHGGGEMPSAANARLIAAAPELLAACHEAAATLEHLGVIGSLPDELNAAIAKAEGRRS